MKNYVYKTKFNLTNPVNDFDAAQEYLSDDDMSEYLKDDISGYDKAKCEALGLHASDIISIDWVLTSDQDGEIILTTNKELSPQELAHISSWVSGQNSDGLGEGFEQQAFAEIYDEDEYGDPDPDSYDMASFDWQTNDYLFKLVKTNESKEPLIDKVLESKSTSEIRELIFSKSSL